eukprot:2061787-Pyramimonas_sp.AAC.1
MVWEAPVSYRRASPRCRRGGRQCGALVVTARFASGPWSDRAPGGLGRGGVGTRSAAPGRVR